MEIKLSKKHKFIWAAFVTSMISVISLGVITASAGAYTGWSVKIVKHITLRTWWKDIIRNIGWNILKFLATVIDYFEDGLADIMSFNMQDLFQHLTGYTNTYPVAWITLTIFMITSAIALMLFDDKIKIKDTVRSILISALLITAFPTLISSLDDLRSRGLADVSNISTDNGNYGLGETLLSSNLILMKESADNQTLTYYSDLFTNDRPAGAIYDFNINQTFATNDEIFNSKVDAISTYNNYTLKYETLDDTNKLKLLGLNEKYTFWKVTQIFRSDNHVPLDGHWYCVSSHNDASQGYHCTLGIGEQTAERYLIQCIANNPEIVAAGRSDNVLARNTLSGALDEATPVLEEMNKIYIDPDEVAGYYVQLPLMTNSEFDAYELADQISQLILVGSKSESIYRYDFDFWFALIFLLVTALALLFAALKCGSLLFDILFTQIIAPVAIATEGTSSGRAKLIIKNLISSYLLFIVIALLLKVYIISITYIHDQFDNYVVSLVLILCFGKGVIDGPDIITRIMGLDAGLKSGVQTIMAINSAMRIAGAAGNTISHTAKSATHAAGTVAGGAVGAAGTIAGGIASGAKKNFSEAKNSVGSAIGNTDFGKNHPTTGKFLSGAAGAANAATGGIVSSVKNAVSNPYKGMSRDNAISSATNKSPTDFIGKGLSSAGHSIAKAGHSAANFAKNTAAGAKAGNQLSHGNFSGAKQTVMDRANSYSSGSAGQSFGESFAAQPANTAPQPQSNTVAQPQAQQSNTTSQPANASPQQQSNTAPQPVTPSSPPPTAPNQQTQSQQSSGKSNTASEPKTKI